MGRAYFTRKDIIYDLLVANRDEQRKNIALWLSMQSDNPRRAPDRYFPPCIMEAAGLIRSENLDDLGDALNQLILGSPGALERVQKEYQTKMDAMDEPIRLLRAALVEAELERETLLKLQRAIVELDKLKTKWETTTC